MFIFGHKRDKGLLFYWAKNYLGQGIGTCVIRNTPKQNQTNACHSVDADWEKSISILECSLKWNLSSFFCGSWQSPFINQVLFTDGTRDQMG